MTKKQKTINETINDKATLANDDHTVLTLTSGVEADMDFTKATGRTLVKARTATNGDFRATAYIIAEVTLFDGKKITGEDILDMDVADYALLEASWNERNEKKLLSAR